MYPEATKLIGENIVEKVVSLFLLQAAIKVFGELETTRLCPANLGRDKGVALRVQSSPPPTPTLPRLFFFFPPTPQTLPSPLKRLEEKMWLEWSLSQNSVPF